MTDCLTGLELLAKITERAKTLNLSYWPLSVETNCCIDRVGAVLQQGGAIPGNDRGSFFAHK